MTPVHDESGVLRFAVASRGHHADVGGLTPGSMPPFSTRLEEEGVVFEAVRIVEAGVFDETTVRATLGAPSHPARNPDENLADLQAQVAANEKGVHLLGRERDPLAEPVDRIRQSRLGRCLERRRLAAANREHLARLEGELAQALPYTWRQVELDPLDEAGFLALVEEVGLRQSRILAKIPSTFLGEMYAGIGLAELGD